MTAAGGLIAGKVVVVTGGSSGIGRATCLRAAEEGAAAVVVASLHETSREGLNGVVAELKERGVDAAFVPTDVAEEGAFDAVVAAADVFGGVDLWVNAAGISENIDFLEIDREHLRTLMGVNFEGTFFGSQAAAKSMIAHGKGGAIVNISSVGGMRGFKRAASYSSSKGAVRAFTYALADAVAQYGIRANVVHPGQVDTEMLRIDMKGGSPIRIPLGRKGRPEEIANLILFLGSEYASYLDGTSVVVDGGYSAVI